MEEQVMTENLGLKTCPYCGAAVGANIKKCKHCGEWLISQKGNSWVKTLLLCSFLGVFGAHNFYNRKFSFAIPQLMLTLTILGIPISAIWVFVDCIMILHDAYTDGEGHKLSKEPTKVSVALLCFFGGISGTHRFYVGRIGSAWGQVLTYGGLVIWTIIDFITILNGRFKDYNGNYIK